MVSLEIATIWSMQSQMCVCVWGGGGVCNDPHELIEFWSRKFWKSAPILFDQNYENKNQIDELMASRNCLVVERHSLDSSDRLLIMLVEF